jgi:hypothetical protein
MKRKTPARNGSGRGKFGFFRESVIHETLARAFRPDDARESTYRGSACPASIYQLPTLRLKLRSIAFFGIAASFRQLN